jgi:putative PEP-CTERM system TPR-repeat lipoprotein
MVNRFPRGVLALFATGLCMVLMLAGCGGKTLSPQDQAARIQKLWQEGQVSEALISLKNLVRTQPDDAGLRLQLADMYLRLGNPEAAKAEIEKGAKLGLDKRTVEILNIRLAVLRNEADVALAKFETAPDIAGDPALKPLHAEILGLMQGKLDAAQALYEEALKEPKPAAEAYQGMGRVLVARGDFKSARKYLDQALSADGSDWNTYMYDADLREREKDFAGAHKSLDKAAQLNPFVIFPALSQVRLDLSEEKFDVAKQRLAVLDKRVAKNPIVGYYKAIVAYVSEDWAAAEDGFRQTLASSPNHAQSQLYLAYLMYRRGNLEQAETYLTVYLQSAPDFEPAKKLLASIQLKRNKADEALKTLGELDTKADSEMLGLKASAYFAVGNSEAGLASLQTAAARAPEDNNLKTALAFATARLGKVDDAIKMLEPDAPLDKQLTQKDTMLLYLYMSRKEWDKVLEMGEKMRAVKGDDPGLLNALASAYVGKKDLPKATELLKTAVAASPGTPTLLSNLALLLLRQGDVTGGSEYVEQLLKIDDKDPANLTLAGTAADARGDTAAAIDYYERVRSANPTATVARLALLSHYLPMQNYAKCVEIANETLKLLPGNLDAMIALGHGLRGQGNLDLAEKVARDAAKIAPKSPNPHFLSGTILYERGNLAEAEKELSLARQGMPTSPEVAVVLARTLIRKAQPKDLTAAEGLIDELAKNREQAATVDALRGDLAIARGDTTAAAAFFESAGKKDGSDGWVIKQAGALMRAGKADAAVEVLQARAAQSSKPVDVLLYLAQLQNQLQRPKEAAATYGKVLSVEPNQLLALNNLALLELDLGVPSALDHAKAAYDLAPKNPQLADTYGWVLFKRGNKELALQILEAAAQGAPEDSGVQFHLAVALLSSGNRKDAATAVQKALRNQDFPERAAAEKLAADLKR